MFDGLFGVRIHHLGIDIVPFVIILRSIPEDVIALFTECHRSVKNLYYRNKGQTYAYFMTLSIFKVNNFIFAFRRGANHRSKPYLCSVMSETNSILMKEKPVIVIDDKIPFIKGVLEPYVEVRYLAPAAIDRTAVRDADMLIVRTRTRCNAVLLDGSRCRFIGTATIGYDHIDADYCRSHGIEWLNAPGCNAASVAQYITASLLRHAEKEGTDLTTKCIGIVGGRPCGPPGRGSLPASGHACTAQRPSPRRERGCRRVCLPLRDCPAVRLHHFPHPAHPGKAHTPPTIWPTNGFSGKRPAARSSSTPPAVVSSTSRQCSTPTATRRLAT